MRARRDEAVRQGVLVGADTRSVAGRIHVAIRGGIVAARTLARTVGVGRLAEELGGRAVIPTDKLAQQLARDARRADVYGKSYARQWLRKAEDAATVTNAAESASKATAAALERTAVTENAEAFNSSRSEVAKRAALGNLKVWDATLDRRTCPVCAAADGTIVGIRERFPHGEPGSVHPYCRCTWTLLTSSEDDSGTLVMPAAVQSAR